MRRTHLLLLLFASVGLFGGPARSQTFPSRPAQGEMILDEAHLVRAEDLQQIQSVTGKLLREQQVPIVVVTIPSLAKYDAVNLESYATALFNNWGIGSKERNNGVLLLVSVGDRKARIELGAGWGNTKDDTARMIMDDIIVPNFKRGDYSAGILQGVNALGTMVQGQTVRKPLWWLPLVLVLTLVVAGVVVGISLIRNGQAGWGWALIAGIGAIVVWLIAIASRLPKSSGDGESYGGGSSGGGGASGSW